MPSSVTLNTGTGGERLTTDQIVEAGTTVQAQYVKLLSGVAGATAAVPGDATDGLYVNLRNVSGNISVSGNVNVFTTAGNEVAIRQTTLDPLNDAGTSTAILFQRISASAAASAVLVTGVASSRIRVLGYTFVALSANTVVFRDTAATPTFLAEFRVADKGGVAFAGTLHSPAFESSGATGLGIGIQTSTDGKIGGHLSYVVL